MNRTQKQIEEEAENFEYVVSCLNEQRDEEDAQL